MNKADIASEKQLDISPIHGRASEVILSEQVYKHSHFFSPAHIWYFNIPSLRPKTHILKIEIKNCSSFFFTFCFVRITNGSK